MGCTLWEPWPYTASKAPESARAWAVRFWYSSAVSVYSWIECMAATTTSAPCSRAFRAWATAWATS